MLKYPEFNLIVDAISPHGSHPEDETELILEVYESMRHNYDDFFSNETGGFNWQAFRDTGAEWFQMVLGLRDPDKRFKLTLTIVSTKQIKQTQKTITIAHTYIAVPEDV